MKANVITLATLGILFICCKKADVMTTNTIRIADTSSVSSTRLTDRSKTGIMAYFKKIIQDKKVLVGQQCSESPTTATDYKKYFQTLFDSTGCYPALLGLEYGYFSNVDLVKTNQFAIDHWKKNGLVTISWHADNPWVDGYNVRWNSIDNKNTIDLNKLTKNAPNSPIKASYRTELQKVAVALKQLKDAGVVVLWRPFHEVNGSWFWWGTNNFTNPTNKSAFQALWKDMYDTFTQEYGLDNLLWVYSPSVITSAYVASIPAMYPGDAYVDLVGADDYTPIPQFRNFAELSALNKVVVNGEIGPNTGGYGSFDQMAVLNAFKGKAAYFLQWHSWTASGALVKVSIKDNLNYKAMMADTSAITLDELK